MKNNKIFIILLAMALVGFLYFNKKNNSNTINIGAVFPMTKNGAQYGQYFKQGCEIAISDAIQKGIIKEGQVKLFIEDGEGDATKSISAFNKLVQNENILVCASALSNVLLAIKPKANSENISLLNASSFSAEIEDAPDYCFSFLPNANEYGKFIAGISYSKLNKRKASIIYRNDPSGKSFKDSYANTFKTLGGEIISEESHAAGATDFKQIILKLKNSNPTDIVFMASYGAEVANFIKQCNEVNFKPQIITYQSFFIPEALKIAGNSANGIVFCASSFNPQSSDSTVLHLAGQLKDKYNSTELNYYVAAQYDAMMALLVGISKNNKTKESIHNYLSNLKDYKGITGDIIFNANGGSSLPLSTYIVENEKFINYEK